MGNLFSEAREQEPLAARMRPRTLEEYVGQEHILGKGRLLRRAIQADRLSSVILYGPPGTGKTTLARVIANTTKSHFTTLNAVLSGVKDLRAEIDEARERLQHYGMRTILFVDEVHRWNKSQQDALLPWVENGTFILIGATTENPYFEVNAALVSRSRIFQLVKLTDSDLATIARQALSDRERGYGKYKVTFAQGALEHLVSVASGDARSLLNALELAVETTPDAFPPPEGSEIHISKEAAEESIQRKAVLYDKEGDYHFDVISAFIKSLRGSDPDAALYWLARMVDAGEDPRFIFRRMIILAAEDVGMADPVAVSVAVSDAEAFDRIGLPEGRYHLAHAAIYLSTCPKSNSALGFFDALSDVQREKDSEVPNHLKDPSRDSKGFGHGKGYLYPHSYREHWVAQQYLPKGLQGKVYYNPARIGYEAVVRDSVLEKREAQLEAVSEDCVPENLTFSPEDRKRSRWIDRAMSGRAESLLRLQKRLYEGLSLPRYSNVLVLNASHGLLLWPLVKMTPEGLAVAQVRRESEKEVIDHFAEGLDELERPVVLVSGKEDLPDMLEAGLRFGCIAGRNVFSRLASDRQFLPVLATLLEEGGKLAFLETVPSLSTRLSELAAPGLGRERLIEAEREIYRESPLSSWGKEDLEEALRQVFPGIEINYSRERETRQLTREALCSFYRNSYRRTGLGEEEFLALFNEGSVAWHSTVAIARYGFSKPVKGSDDFLDFHLKGGKPSPSLAGR